MVLLCRYAKASNPGGGETDPLWLLPMPDEIQQWTDPDDASYAGACDVLGAGAVELSASDLLARAQDIHARYPITDPSTGAPYTDEALEAAVTAWISAAGA